MKSRIIYIIPGIGESSRSKNYREIIKFAKKAGFLVVPINIKWEKDKTMSNFIRQADSQIPSNITQSYILGFSFGAYIASLLSTKKLAKGYIFCSISPYFKDDLKYIPNQTKKYFGKILMNSFKKYSFPQKTKSKAWFLVGDKEWDLTIKRVKKSYDNWGGQKKLYIINSAQHKLSHPKYIEKVKYILKRL